MKLQINNRKKAGKYTNIWRLKNMLLNHQQIKEELKRELKKYLRQTKTAPTKFMGCCKSISRGKFIEVNAYIKKQEIYANYISIKKERSQINNFTLHLKELKVEA